MIVFLKCIDEWNFRVLRAHVDTGRDLGSGTREQWEAKIKAIADRLALYGDRSVLCMEVK